MIPRLWPRGRVPATFTPNIMGFAFCQAPRTVLRTALFIADMRNTGWFSNLWARICKINGKVKKRSTNRGEYLSFRDINHVVTPLLNKHVQTHVQQLPQRTGMPSLLTFTAEKNIIRAKYCVLGSEFARTTGVW